VATLLITDTLGLIAVVHMLYEYTVTGYGSVMSMAVQRRWCLVRINALLELRLPHIDWQWPVMAVTTGISALVSQGFLVSRVHRFTKSLWVTLPLLVLTLAAVSAIHSGIPYTKVRLSSYSDPLFLRYSSVRVFGSLP
jgi:hypothetical protein